MAKFPTYEEMGKKVAEKALDEFLHDGKSIREWMQIIASEDAISRQAVLDATVKKNSIWNSITNSKSENLEEIISQLPPINSQKPCKDAISREAVLDALCNNCELCKNGEQVCFSKCEEYHFLATLPPVNPQKPICPIHGVYCEDCSAYEKKLNKWIGAEVLDKIRAEIENDWQLKKYPSSPFACGLRRAIEIIDKYKADSEG